MKKIVSCSQMKELDRRTIQERKIPSCVLMERAALKVVEEIEAWEQRTNGKKRARILVACGSGNNGGDGIAIARILHLRGWRAAILFLGNPERMTEEARLQWEIAGNYQVPVVNNLPEDEYTTIVDAIFGIGLARPIEGRYAEAIQLLNNKDGYKVAVDIPSGIHGDYGTVMGTAFRADCTVTFAYNKRGMLFYPGREYAGKTIVADIGIYGAEECEHCLCLEKEDLYPMPYRAPGGNKGTFGKILFLAGSKGMCGAAYMGASAALKTGAGMVMLQTDEANRIPLHTLLPEAMISCDYSEKENERLFQWCDIIVAGPGIGCSKESKQALEWYLKQAFMTGKRMILDADGLNLLSQNPEWKAYLGKHMVITPHLGEMSRLTKFSIKEIKERLLEVAEAYVKETGVCCVLKDAATVISERNAKSYINHSGNAGMAGAGSGDVLAGILAGVFAMYLQEDSLKSNARLAAEGVLIHGLSGDKAKERLGERGMTATDILAAIPEICRDNKEY